MKIKRFVCNAFQENAYVVSDGAECIIIDPGFTGSELPALYDYLAAEGLTPSAILLTHSHPDHTCGLQALVERYGIAVFQAKPSGAFPAEPSFGEDRNDAGSSPI